MQTLYVTARYLLLTYLLTCLLTYLPWSAGVAPHG